MTRRRVHSQVAAISTSVVGVTEVCGSTYIATPARVLTKLRRCAWATSTSAFVGPLDAGWTVPRRLNHATPGHLRLAPTGGTSVHREVASQAPRCGTGPDRPRCVPAAGW